MTCRPFKAHAFGAPNGTITGIICTRGPKPRCQCCERNVATLLCDFPLKGAKEGKTCDRRMCDRCAQNAGPDTDYCPAHARLLNKENEK